MSDFQTELQKENEFWRFSFTVYGAPDVAAECLALQDALSIDVNLLLFCAWIGASRRTAITEADEEGARRVVGAWHEQAVRPLRHVRQFMKAFANPDCQVLRARVKENELEAEQIEQAMLFMHAETVWPRMGITDPSLAVPANIQMFLQSQQNIVGGEAVLPQGLIQASVRHGG
jgi:uncharacterized protein (TIGR02444 family)